MMLYAAFAEVTASGVNRVPATVLVDSLTFTPVRQPCGYLSRCCSAVKIDADKGGGFGDEERRSVKWSANGIPP